MFGKVKRWLGIEGVKVELDIPDEVLAGNGSVDGTVRFYSMHDQLVKSINIRMIEKYKRGRRKNKLVDEYILGEIKLEQDIEVPAHEEIAVDFNLPFDLAMSDMDHFQRKNFV
ncbi:MAG: sporulation protein, partial [Saprospiraceae bacterium]|nr:sporulation protein [Saprospiraceae bacterium]